LLRRIPAAQPPPEEFCRPLSQCSYISGESPVYRTCQISPQHFLRGRGASNFFSRKALTWDGWHPYTDPGSYVFANLAIMQINRLIAEGKIKGRPIPLRKLSDEYFGTPAGLIIFVPQGFPRVTRPQIVGPAGEKIPLRSTLPEQWAQRHGVFSVGESYFQDLALSWERLGPKPLIIRARSFSGATLFLSKKDRDILTAQYRNRTALKGGLLLWGQNMNEEIIPREDTFFLNQIEKDPGILKTLSLLPVKGEAAPWDYLRDCRKSQKMAILAVSHIIKSITYKC
jgi:hypothetical protein